MGGLNYWLLKETKGVRPLDKCILYCLKVIYLGLRILLRIALGRKRRDRIFIEQGFDFNTFLYRVFKILRLDNSMLLKISVPKYDYKFYCRYWCAYGSIYNNSFKASWCKWKSSCY